MLITKNGVIDGIPRTSMVEKDGVWMHLLVCQFPLGTDMEMLMALFDTDTVEDDAIGVKWEYTQFEKIAEDETGIYVWLTYTVQQIASNQYVDALNTLGIETEVVEDEAV